MPEDNKDIKVAPSRPGAPNRPAAPQRPGPAPVAPNRPGAPVVPPQRPGQPVNAKPVEGNKPVAPVAPQRPTQPVVEKKETPVAPQRPTVTPQSTSQPVSKPEPQKETLLTRLLDLEQLLQLICVLRREQTILILNIRIFSNKHITN